MRRSSILLCQLFKILSKTLTCCFGIAFLSYLPVTVICDPVNQPDSQPVTTNQDLFNSTDPALIFSGEFIYWTVVEGGLDYAVRMTKPLSGTSTLPQGDVESARFDWDPGYRFSLGYFRAPNFWELISDYTFLHVNGDDHIERPLNSDLFLNGTFPQIFSGNLSRATSEIFLHYQLINLTARRVFFPVNNPHLRLRLGAGITGTWLRQSWKVQYFSESNEITKVRNRWRYWGFGPRMHLGFDWFWGSDGYVTGQFSTALVVGHYRNRFGQDTLYPIGNSQLQDYRLSFNIQFILGPSYQKSFDWGRIEVFIGYEFTTWTQLQEIYRSTPSSPEAPKQLWINSSAISLHGLTTRLTLNF